MIYFTRLVVVFLILFGAWVSALGQADFNDPKKLGQWMTFYYLSPQPDRLAAAILAASKQGLLSEEKSAPPFFGFIAGCLSGNPPAGKSLVDVMASLPPKDQPVVVLGLYYSGTSSNTALLRRVAVQMPEQRKRIDHLLSSRPQRLVDIPLERGPWVLDALWGYFMATGDDAPVIRIMSALPWSRVQGDMPRWLIGNAAKWSLTANAGQHARVLAICRAQVRLQPEETASCLKEVIASAEAGLRKRSEAGSNQSSQGSSASRRP